MTTLISATSASATYLAVRARQRRAQRLALVHRIAACDVDLPLRVEHLSPRLAALTVGARTVRLLLETPLQRFRHGLLRETPWKLREKLVDYDLALGDARLALWQWVRSLARLDAQEIEILRGLKLDPRPLAAVIYERGVFERTSNAFDESWYPEAPDLDNVTEALCTAMAGLRHFEISLLSLTPDPYR